jgi:hypothetical protein
MYSILPSALHVCAVHLSETELPGQLKTAQLCWSLFGFPISVIYVSMFTTVVYPLKALVYSSVPYICRLQFLADKHFQFQFQISRYNYTYHYVWLGSRQLKHLTRTRLGRRCPVTRYCTRRWLVSSIVIILTLIQAATVIILLYC